MPTSLDNFELEVENSMGKAFLLYKENIDYKPRKLTDEEIEKICRENYEQTT